MISILMATHNPVENFLKKSLDSIFNQSYRNFELVLVDDGSDVPVIRFLKNENYDLSKVNYIRLEKNVGLPTALNIGLKVCKGEFIARMDDDDLMDLTRLEKQLNFIQSQVLDGCFCWYENIDKNDIVVSKRVINLHRSKYLKQLLKKGNIFCHASLFVKKSVLDDVNGYDENLRYAQDSDLYIRILKKYKMGMIDEFLVQHRVNDYRNNKYRETLSLTYALFGVANYFTSKEQISFKDIITIFSRVFRYCVGLLKIVKK